MKKLGNRAKKKVEKLKSKKIFGNQERPRVVFSKSNQYLTVQAIDDTKQHTVAYLCSRELVKKTENTSSEILKTHKSKEIASKLGVRFAKDLSRKNIKDIVFDRNGYIYHGKIKTFCDRMREQGISF